MVNAGQDRPQGDGLVIRPPRPEERSRWEPLWQGYLRFYRQQLDPAVTETSWLRFLDPGQQPHALVAAQERELLGFTTYVFHRSSWSVQPYCYLEDLFVAPAGRGRGVGRRLIQAVYAAADAAGASSVYWHTQEFNAEARALYDTLARRTSHIVYQR